MKNSWLLVLLGSLILLVGLAISNAPGRVRAGDTVTIHYTLTLDDGMVYDSTLGRQPLTTTLGQGEFIASFEDELLGMQPGEVKTFTLLPEEAFGEYRPDLVGTVDRSWLPQGVEPVVGKQLQTKLEDGTQKVVTIKSFTDTSLTLDANHPLAGKSLTFDIKLVSIEGIGISIGSSQEALIWTILAVGISVFGFVFFSSRNRRRFITVRVTTASRKAHR